MNSFLNNIEGKGAIMKQRILGLCINDGDFSIAELSKELNASIPTVTRLIGELIEDGFLRIWGRPAHPAADVPAYSDLIRLPGILSGRTSAGTTSA